MLIPSCCIRQHLGTAAQNKALSHMSDKKRLEWNRAKRILTITLQKSKQNAYQYSPTTNNLTHIHDLKFSDGRKLCITYRNLDFLLFGLHINIFLKIGKCFLMKYFTYLSFKLGQHLKQLKINFCSLTYILHIKVIGSTDIETSPDYMIAQLHY